jgi:hypothetical protein
VFGQVVTVGELEESLAKLPQAAAR